MPLLHQAGLGLEERVLEKWLVAQVGPGAGECRREGRGGEGGGVMPAHVLLQAKAGVAWMGLDPTGTIFQWEESAEALFGYDIARMTGRDVRCLVPSPEEGETLRGFFKACLRGTSVSEVSTACVTDRGTILFCRWYAVPATRECGQTGLAVLVKDVTEQMLAVNELNRVRNQARSLFSSSPIGIFQVDNGQHLLVANPELSWMLGYESPEQLTATIHDVSSFFVEPEQAEAFLFQLYEGEQLNRFRCQLHRRDGGFVWALCYGQITRNAKDRVNGFYGFCIDISLTVRVEEELKRVNEKFRLASIRDATTGIANRGYFDECISTEWNRHARKKTELSIIMCDIDNFKLYNDTYGHQAGDHCLAWVAETLTSCVRRPGDLVARYGGEEFVVILPHTDLSGARHLAEKMRRRVEELAVTDERSEAVTHVTLSLGVASMFPDRDARESELIHLADEALYKAKELGRNRCVVSGE